MFEPADPSPASAPLVILNHGWGGIDPAIYRAWIDHLVRRGNIVVFPRYQADLRTPTREFTPNAVRAVSDAIDWLQHEGTVEPDLDRVAIVGHSAGGLVTANVAATARSAGIPAPRAVMSVEPGKTWTRSKRIAIPLADMSGIAEGTLLLTVIGDTDRVVRDVNAKKIYYGASRVSADDKDFVTLVSDGHGSPALNADHFAPCTGSGGRSARGVNPLDYYGTWKLFDGLCDAAFGGAGRPFALGNTPEQRFMGKWSDGTPVKELPGNRQSLNQEEN